MIKTKLNHCASQALSTLETNAANCLVIAASRGVALIKAQRRRPTLLRRARLRRSNSLCRSADAGRRDAREPHARLIAVNRFRVRRRRSGGARPTRTSAPDSFSFFSQFISFFFFLYTTGASRFFSCRPPAAENFAEFTERGRTAEFFRDRSIKNVRSIDMSNRSTLTDTAAAAAAAFLPTYSLVFIFLKRSNEISACFLNRNHDTDKAKRERDNQIKSPSSLKGFIIQLFNSAIKFHGLLLKKLALLL